MFDKSLIALLTSSILSCSISTAWGQESNKLEITFACEDDNDIPITVATNKNKEEQTETIFYWREEALIDKTPSTPQELCDNVSLKLNDVAGEYDLSSFNIVPTEQFGLAAICVSSSNYSCSKVLFAMNPNLENPSPYFLAEDTLEVILNPKIVENYRKKDSYRHSYVSYEIDFFEFFNK